MLPTPMKPAIAIVALLGWSPLFAADNRGPYERQVQDNVSLLTSNEPLQRSVAAERLGMLRAYSAELALIERMQDDAAEVRRQATLALAWCGGRRAVASLLAALGDEDWTTRQAAHVALQNVTGMDFPFDALAAPEVRARQAGAWRDWWQTVPEDRPPQEVLDLFASVAAANFVRTVTASSTYKGPPEVLVDGQLGPEYWQTKSVKPPQWCCLDLGELRDVHQVTVHQYGPGYCMTEYELAVSTDGVRYETVERAEGKTPPKLVIQFPARKARYVKITSFGAERSLYPTTFYEIEINESNAGSTADAEKAWQLERGLRARGALGGEGDVEAILQALGDVPRSLPNWRVSSRAGLRSLGRLGGEAAFEYLVQLLDNTLWARYAADALGDLGDPRAIPPLLDAYGRYAKRLDGMNPPDVPADDRMSFPSEDRMLETPYHIALALSRLSWDDPANRTRLSELAPQILANLPNDHDTFIVYESELPRLVTRYLLDVAGDRQEACDHVLEALGTMSPEQAPTSATLIPSRWPTLPPYWMAAWLPVICTHSDDVARLIPLLDHPEGYVRINAAKALALIGDRRAIRPLAERLRAAKAEADYGYNLVFKHEEYDDPAPRWREALIRALGILQATEQTELLIGILNDERSVLEIRRAAADALADLGNPGAVAALRLAAEQHSFASIRHVARDAVRRLVDLAEERAAPTFIAATAQNANGSVPHARHDEPRVAGPQRASIMETPPVLGGSFNNESSELLGCEAIVFVQGSNDLPNNHGTVVQADWWRETYAVTDEGPVYRPGANLFVLRPPRPDGQVTPLTRFTDGYVAEPEVSWDGTQILFTRRTADEPWWQICRIQADGTGLVQLTHGPYHHAGPAWLPDGRIVFGTSRSGIRDEYHAYPCTALWVMNPDGSQMQPIATNIGRDNEPAILLDGRIAFSRLEVFYSRNKTELTLHAVRPDGSQDVVLYGPERRAFWRGLDHGPPSPADGQESPLTHRVLRISQPQPMPDGRSIVVTSQAGFVLLGPNRFEERLICPDYRERAYTTPFPLPDGRILCATTWKGKGPEEVDLGLYVLDPVSGKLALVYNDPAHAEYEARPLQPRTVPPMPVSKVTPEVYSGRFLCASVFNTQETEVRQRGRLVRLVEGVPMVARHSTHTNPWPVWQNHGGTFARILGTAPLAADGSFHVEVPADRLLHLQVLDSDRRVVGNQLTWIYARPGEVKSCVGCHENPHTTAAGREPLAAGEPALDFLPHGEEFTYRAKAWFKGSLPGEIEERTRTVHAVNLLGR